MNKRSDSILRKTLLLATTTLAALGVTLGLPAKKATAATQDMQASPAMNHAMGAMTIIQPKFVNPSTAGLLKLADQALMDNGLADRIARDPDGVAAQYHLSNAERLVLRHMNREQFEVARADAARLVASRMTMARSMRMPPGATDARQITERMIVGRAILAAVGRSYLDAADAHACCPWSKAIELGLSSDPVTYNAAFVRPAGMNMSH